MEEPKIKYHIEVAIFGNTQNRLIGNSKAIQRDDNKQFMIVMPYILSCWLHDCLNVNIHMKWLVAGLSQF